MTQARATCASSRVFQGGEARSCTLIRMPSWAPTPVPTMTAVGVARPRAQGHEITTTLMPNSEANRPYPCPCGTQAAGYMLQTPAQYLHSVRFGRNGVQCCP